MRSIATHLDVTAAVCVLGITVMILRACQVNIQEAPMNKGGSSYVPSALCNQTWGLAHPETAKIILKLPMGWSNGFALLMAVVLKVTGVFTIPAILFCYFIVRILRAYDRPFQLAWLIPCLILVLLSLFVVRNSMAVMLD